MRALNLKKQLHGEIKGESFTVGVDNDINATITYHLPDGVNYYIRTVNTRGNINQKMTALRFYKLIYKNRETFEKEVLSKITKIELLTNLSAYFDKAFNYVSPLTPLEAMQKLSEAQLARAFEEFNIPEIILSFNPKRIAVSGKELTKKRFDLEGNRLSDVTYSAIYETYEVVIPFQNEIITAYAIKCWCTTTEKEHWLWLEEQYKDDPLEAIASTFRVHQQIIPYIKELKRQGDILLVELTQDVNIDEPFSNSSLVPLTAEQYFSLLTIES